LSKKVCAAMLALCLVLSGCTSMLERDYVSATRHVEYHAEDEASVVQAESYQGLVSAILYFVTSHDETGVVHLSNYTGDVATDLEEACTEILEEDSIGAYALEDIEHEFSRIVSYYEIKLTFTYEHTAEEVQEIWAATSTSTMFRRAKEALGSLKESCAVNVYYLNRDKASLITEMRQIWLDSPLVLEEPEIRVRLYPESGTSNQVVEYTFVWEEEREELAARSSMILAAAKRLLEEIAPGEAGEAPGPLELAAALRQRVTLDMELGGGTAYDALVSGSANRRGMTMALKVLCDLSELNTTVVEGRLGGESAWWLIAEDVELGIYRHLDPSEETPEYGWDESLRALGYEWSGERYPTCETPPESEQTGEGETGETGGETTDGEAGVPETQTLEETGEKTE